MVHFETLIVGAGMAGLAAASRADTPVVLMEAGPPLEVRHKNLLPGREAPHQWRFPDRDPTFKRYWATTLKPHFDEGSGLRVQLGGRSNYWHGVCLPIEERALCAWPQAVVDELKSSAAGVGSYQATSNILNRWMKQHGSAVRLDACRGPREQAFIDLLVKAAFKPRPVPQAAYELQVGDEVRQVPYTPLPEVQAHRHKFMTGCRVLELGPDKRGVRLLVDDGGTTSAITASRVILAGGTIESTRLVAMAKMRLHGEKHAAYPGLSDHLVQGFMANIPRGYFDIPPSLGRAFCYQPALDEADSNLFWELTPSADGETERLVVWTMGEKLPANCEVQVEALPGPAAAHVRIDHIVHPKDLNVVERQVSLLNSVAERLLGPDRQGIRITTDDWQRGTPSWLDAFTAAERAQETRQTKRGGPIKVHPFVRPLGSIDHEAGTLPLGSVLDTRGVLPELPEVSVVGPATFPRSGAANPTLTILALARAHLTSLDQA